MLKSASPEDKGNMTLWSSTSNDINDAAIRKIPINEEEMFSSSIVDEEKFGTIVLIKK
jgi:GH15 family glucan-1,4-alpha-glucosidase